MNRTPITLVGDGIENPGNALTMIHAAGMFGSECVFRDRHGLAEVLPAIEAQLGRQSVVIELNSLQVVLLSTSLSSVISELKMYSVFDTMSGGSGRPRSTAPGFDDRLRRLFPEIA